MSDAHACTLRPERISHDISDHESNRVIPRTPHVRTPVVGYVPLVPSLLPSKLPSHVLGSIPGWIRMADGHLGERGDCGCGGFPLGVPFGVPSPSSFIAVSASSDEDGSQDSLSTLDGRTPRFETRSLKLSAVDSASEARDRKEPASELSLALACCPVRSSLLSLSAFLCGPSRLRFESGGSGSRTRRLLELRP